MKRIRGSYVKGQDIEITLLQSVPETKKLRLSDSNFHSIPRLREEAQIIRADANKSTE